MVYKNKYQGVHLINVPYFGTAVESENSPLTQCENYPVPDKCWSVANPFEASSIDCWNIRQCNSAVHLEAAHSAVMEAYYHVLTSKWSEGSGEQ